MLKFVKYEKFILKSLITNNFILYFLNMNKFYFRIFLDYTEFKNTTFKNNVLNFKSLFLVTEWKYVT